MHRLFVSERIVVEPGSFDPAIMSRGEPSPPRSFGWRGRRFEIKHLKATSRVLGEDRGDRYVRRHVFEVETSDRLRMTIYFERNPADRRTTKAWWLYAFSFPQPLLHTTRLSLRRWTYADGDAFRRMTQDADVMRFVPEPAPLTDAQADAALESTIERYDRLGFGDWALLFKEGGEPIGECGLNALDAGKVIEIGWMLMPAHWGKGLAFEAASAVKAFAFGELGLTRIVARMRAENHRSVALATRLGMRLAGHASGGWAPLLEYELTR